MTMKVTSKELVKKDAPTKVALPDPANIIAAPQGRSTITVVVVPGELYGLSIPQDGQTKVLPFKLSSVAADGPVPVVIASTNANWLGRNGAKLNVHLCASEHGVVAIQPHDGGGFKANLYTKGHVSIELM